MNEKVREKVREIIKDVELFIGYERGFDAIHATPCFIKKEEEVERLIWDETCVHNLCSYLFYLKEKVGVLVKGCDSRTIIQYLQEELIERERVVILGVPCDGVIDVKKIMEQVGFKPVIEFSSKNGNLIIKTIDEEREFPKEDFLLQKCKTCLYPTPLIYDHLLFEPITSKKDKESVYEDILEFEKNDIKKRLSFWMEELDRCIRCYACRNACPMCICRDSCIAETREPKWISQRLDLSEKFMFHMIHTLHLAGRCVECGECERACPMNIPLLKLKKKMNMEIKRLFDYEAGVKLDQKPPMLTFKVEEERIKEPEI